MNHRERIKAILNYAPYDRMPVVHFGFWKETLEKWRGEGHLTAEEITGVDNGNAKETAIAARLGFDFNWYTTFQSRAGFGLLFPPFERKVLEELPSGMQKVLNEDGVVVLEKPGVRSIPPEVGHLLKDRKSWEEHYLPRLQFSDDRIDLAALRKWPPVPRGRSRWAFIARASSATSEAGWASKASAISRRTTSRCTTRSSGTVGELAYRTTERILSVYADFDFAHFWEDICFRVRAVGQARCVRRPKSARTIAASPSLPIATASISCRWTATARSTP